MIGAWNDGRVGGHPRYPGVTCVASVAECNIWISRMVGGGRPIVVFHFSRYIFIAVSWHPSLSCYYLYILWSYFWKTLKNLMKSLYFLLLFNAVGYCDQSVCFTSWAYLYNNQRRYLINVVQTDHPADELCACGWYLYQFAGNRGGGQGCCWLNMTLGN